MNRSIRTWLLAGVAAAVMAAAVSAGQPATGTVKGSVRGADGRPVRSARVVIDSAGDSSYTGTTSTDQEGRFTIADAPLGAVNLQVYDGSDRVIARGTGTLRHAGETITLVLRAP